MTSTPHAVRARARPAGPSSLVVFFKAPGRAKRRLVAALGAATDTAAGHLLACALEDARGWTGRVVLAAADTADAAWLEQAHPGAGEIVIQRSGTLGERINHVDAELRSRGLDRLIYVGADCPALDTVYLTRADIALGRADAVLGPALDGGVVLMGARKPWPDIGHLAWSTPQLHDGLTELLRGRGWTVATLPALRDVDDADDLAAVAAELDGDTRPARAALVDWLRP